MPDNWRHAISKLYTIDMLTKKQVDWLESLSEAQQEDD